MYLKFPALLFILFFTTVNAFSQPEKKIKKCIELFETEPKEAALKLKKLIDKAGKEARTDAWDIYVEMYETIYNRKLEVGMTESEYALVESDLMRFTKMKAEYEALNDITSSDYTALVDLIEELNFALTNPDFYASYDDYIRLSDACREASLKSVSIRADGNLRTMYLTHDPDTMSVDSMDVKNYADAYNKLNAGELEESKVLLDSIVLKYPESYNIGMCYYLYYYYKKEMDSAKIWLKATIEQYPMQLEPRENLAKILFSEGNIFRAKEQIEELIVLFPGQDMKGYYSEVLFVEDKMLEEKRIIRPVYPNQIGVDYPLEKNHWGDYQRAKFKVNGFSDLGGIIRKNDLTSEKYLEIYSWKKMLDKNREKKPTELLFAYEMEEKGLLDCYVFFSNYHLDFALQLQDFASSEENRERMKKFIRDYLVVLAQ